MPASVTKVGSPIAVGNQFHQKAVVTVGVYETGGVPLTADDFSLTNLEWVEITSGVVLGSPHTGIVVVQWDRDNKKLRAYNIGDSPASELLAGADLGKTALQVVAIGA